MGYPTDFIGHVDVTPPLNEAEVAYLTAFSRSRRWERPGGPYDVPRDPRAEDADVPASGEAGRRYHRPPLGQPGLWCDWEPCWEGCCLAYNGVEKFFGAAAWLRYLVDHFLRPGAVASGSDDPRFAAFAFDHVLDGMVVGCRRDTKELFAIKVTANLVREEVLRRADRRFLGCPPLPYESAIDRTLPPALRRRRDRPAQVLPFTRDVGA